MTIKKRILAFLIAIVVVPTLTATLSSAQEKGFTFYGVQIEELEYRFGDEDERLVVWDGDAFVGTDEVKFRWISEGEYDTRASKYEALENRLVVQMPISDFFDATAGFRLDSPAGPDRWYGSVGISGLAKQWFEIDTDLFLSEKGDASARLDVEYELLLTNRLILIPSVEINVGFSDDSEISQGSGLREAELGLRLSYDVIDRTVSPYIGIAWERKFGRTADFASDEGEDTEAWFIAIGVRMLF